MPPKRRGAQAKSGPATKATPPERPKPSSSSKPTLAPVPPPPPPPPPQPVELAATKVRKEWSKFMNSWYEPQKKKLVEKLQKDILIKYKSLGSPKETQKLREMELFERLDSIAQQLSQPARTEWERRLELAQLHEDQWDDMSGEEQQAVMSVFVGFFADDIEDMEEEDVSAEPSSIEEDESAIEEPNYRGVPFHPPSVPSAPPFPPRQSIPPTPIRGNFEFVNPTSFFADTMTPPNPTKNLPALSMDHLATLGPFNVGRSAEPASASVGSVFSFQNWASEAGIVAHQPQGQSTKSLAATTSAQTLGARPRATDNMSRQASTTSNLSSPPTKTSSPPYSPPNPPTKFSPPINAETLPLGKRYIGPIIVEEEPDPMDEDLKSKMAEEYQQYKVGLRIQMIYQFHAEAAEVEIKLFETLSAGGDTKESRARAVQEHETSMMRLREQKEEERKRLCAEERERRREEMRQHLVQRRSATLHQEVDPGHNVNPPPKPGLEKSSVQDRPSKPIHQKESAPLLQPSALSSDLEAPSIIKQSNSTLSLDEASANEAIFANAMATMTQGKASAALLTPAQASANEAVFSNATAMLAAQGQIWSNGKNTLQSQSAMKKSNSSRSQEYDIPQITVNFAGNPAPTPESTQVPPTTVRGKKGKKGQPGMQLPPTKPVTIAEEPETDAEPPLSVSSLWDAASVVARNARDTGSASISAPKAKLSVSVEEENAEPTSVGAPMPSKANASTKKPTPAAKKGRKVTITEEADADDSIIFPPSSKTKATKGAWGLVNGKSKAAPPTVKENEPEPTPPPPSMTPVWGKKSVVQPATKSTMKPQLKVSISEESESEFERSLAPTPGRTNKAKSAWEVPAAAPSAGTSMQVSSKATQHQVEPRPGGMTSGSGFVRVNTVPDPEGQWSQVTSSDNTMPGAVDLVVPEQAEEGEGEEDDEAGAWFKPEDLSYWTDFMGSQSEPDPETQPRTVPQTIEQTGEHVRWTPTASEESDDDGFGDAEADLATNAWMQYAISGGGIPSFSGALEEPQSISSENTQSDTSLWEQGKNKKKLNSITGDFGNRAQQTSVFDRAALTGQWPKMESWLSPPSRGQNSGSARVF